MADIIRRRQQQVFSQTDTAVTGAGNGSQDGTEVAFLSANPDRTGFTVSNTHASQTISLGFGTTAVTGRGVVITAGTTYQNSNWLGAVRIVASGASTTYGYTEF